MYISNDNNKLTYELLAKMLKSLLIGNTEMIKTLLNIFHKDLQEANRLMMMVHKSGSAVIGAYPYDVAATKVSEAMARAKAEGFPFRMRVEEA